MKARKLVVISSGAFGTPAILERSGVGAKDILEKAGVEVRVELPAVGATYEDHQVCSILLSFRRPSQKLELIKSSSDLLFAIYLTSSSPLLPIE